MLNISPKLAGAVGPPLTAVVTAMILTNQVDRTSLAAFAAIVIGALLGYHAPAGNVKVAEPMAAPSEHPFDRDLDRADVTHFDQIDDDGDTQLPAELADRDIDPTPVDEVDVADLNHPEVN